MSTSALAGKRIVITRPRHKADSFADKLREHGAIPVLMPTIAIQPPGDPVPLDAALRDLARYDWAIFTSANTVTHIWARFDALDAHPAPDAWPRVAAIGPATAKALRKRGIEPALVPAEHVAEALFAALADRAPLRGARVLLPQGDLARPVLADLLRGAGADVTAVIAYENVPPEIDPDALAVPLDAITFTSPSTAQNFAAQFDDPFTVIGDARIACIGPVTADAVRALGFPVHIVAEPHTVNGLVSALIAAFERTSESSTTAR